MERLNEQQIRRLNELMERVPYRRGYPYLSEDEAVELEMLRYRKTEDEARLHVAFQRGKEIKQTHILPGVDFTQPMTPEQEKRLNERMDELLARTPNELGFPGLSEDEAVELEMLLSRIDEVDARVLIGSARGRDTSDTREITPYTPEEQLREMWLDAKAARGYPQLSEDEAVEFLMLSVSASEAEARTCVVKARAEAGET